MHILQTAYGSVKPLHLSEVFIRDAVVHTDSLDGHSKRNVRQKEIAFGEQNLVWDGRLQHKPDTIQRMKHLRQLVFARATSVSRNVAH
jgi:hypothetical protein